MTTHTIPSENLPRYIYKPNLVILAPFFQKLPRGIAFDYGQTDGQTRVTTRAEG